MQELDVEWCGLEELQGNLPHNLRKLFAANNRLRRLPANIVNLVQCEMHVESNPLEDIPHIPDDQPGPIIHFSMADAEGDGVVSSPTIAQAVQHWLSAPLGEPAARWSTLGQALESEPDKTNTTAAFREFLDRLRGTISYRNADARANVEEWLSELSKPERTSLLKDTLQACVTATEQCNDRVALTLIELRKWRLHDDIRFGRYNDRPGQALAVMQQLFCLKKLQDIAYRKMGSMNVIDDVEVYLGYAVKLRERLKLSTTVVPDMNFFNLSGITDEDLEVAFREVKTAENTEFYKELILDDTWNAFIKQNLGERHDQAMEKRSELEGKPLEERIRAKLVNLGFDPDHPEVQQEFEPSLGASLWRDMQYEILEPLTRDFLTSKNVSVPYPSPTESYLSES
jgi:hypothetical protein